MSSGQRQHYWPDGRKDMKGEVGGKERGKFSAEAAYWPDGREGGHQKRGRREREEGEFRAEETEI